MPLRVSQSVRVAWLNALTDLVGRGGAFVLYSGTPPRTVDSPLVGNRVLARLPLMSPLPFEEVKQGEPTTVAVRGRLEGHGAETGTATFGSIVNGAGTRVMDFNVATSKSDFNLNTTEIQAGALVSVVSQVFGLG